ncbi:MAG: T9SS type A sorting domain-containing protein [Bacteroidota bacterium]
MYAQFYRSMLAIGLFFSFSIFANAQLQVKLALIQNNKWGVFVKPVGIDPSESTVTGSARLTVIMPIDYEWSNLKSINGLWVNDVTVSTYPEAPGMKYVFFGLVDAEPTYPIPYSAGEETLLFTFDGSGSCPEFVHMLDCTDPTDPGCSLYSMASDPGEEISVVDFGGAGVEFYGYDGSSIYALAAWDCNDNDDDGFANGLEDLNGDGEYNVGETDLNDANDFPEPSGLELKLQLLEANRWGVFVKSEDLSSEEINTISGQVTLVMPKNFDQVGFQSVHGLWAETSSVVSPSENPSAKYVTYSLIQSEPDHPINFNEDDESLLFTYYGEDGSCPNFMRILQCGLDPFCPPNSAGTNPLNDLMMLDVGANIGGYYMYTGNYATKAWDCKDNDGDGILNAFEDTNGNGIYDSGDASDLNLPQEIPLDDGLKLKLQLMDEDTWGVYVTPHNVSPDSTTITGSGQVTVVMPAGFAWSGLTSVSGLWQNNATVVSPLENPNAQYVSFGLVQAEPNYPIYYTEGVDQLLFTFDRDEACPWFMHILDCENPNFYDPYCAPNSMNSNPGNDLSVIQFSAGIQYYNYVGNFARHAWDCFDNDGDGYANGLEDTNGNGFYDEDDESDLDDVESIPVEEGFLFKLQLIAENRWGVYAKPHGIFPDSTTITTEGRVTVVMPNGTTLDSFTSYNGQWGTDMIIDSPSENPDAQYTIFQLMSAQPNYPMYYTPGAETLLFSFEVDGCPDFLYLTDCGSENPSDPYCFNDPDESSPNNILEVAHIGNGGVTYYKYVGNYATAAWDCNDFDDDGILNAFEDTNGNGLYDEGIDASDLYSACSPNSAISANIYAINDHICYGDLSDTALVAVDITEGLAPYTIVLSNSYIDTTLNLYYSGNTIRIRQPISEIYTLVNVIDANGCPTNPDSLFGFVEVTVDGPLYWSSMPADERACQGNSVSFDAFANGTTDQDIFYQWQMSPDGQDYQDLTDGGIYDISGADSTIITFGAVDIDLHDYHIRLKAWSSTCEPIYSDYAQFEVHGDLGFAQHPSDKAVCSGDPVCFSVEAFNNGAGTIQYRWQWSIDGSFWAPGTNGSLSSGANTDVYCISDISGNDSLLYRCRINTSECDYVYSETALLVEEGPVAFDDHPDDVFICASETAIFEATASIQTGNSGEVAYQWQASSDGINFNNLTDGGLPGYAGAFTDQLKISLPVSDLDGWHFRLAAKTETCNTKYSFSAVLHVEGPLEVTEQPLDYVNCPDAEALFLAHISNPSDPAGLHTEYQWQILLPGSNDWQDLTNGDTFNGTNIIGGANSDTLLITPLFGLDGAQVRMLGWTDSCPALMTDVASILISNNCLPEITNHPVGPSIQVCQGESAALQVCGAYSEGDFYFSWEFSNDGGVTWDELLVDADPNFTQSSGGNPMSQGCDVLMIQDVSNLIDFQFRAVLNWDGGAMESEVVEIIQLEPLLVNLQPVDEVGCEDGEALFFIDVDSPLDPTGLNINYQWQIKTSNGNDWENIEGISSGGVNVFGGYNSDSLLITPLVGLNGAQVRVRAWSNQCDEVFSEPANIGVEGPLVFTQQPMNVSNCGTGQVCFTVEAESLSGYGDLQYGWEYSQNGNLSNWVEILSPTQVGPIFTGFTTNQLCIENSDMMYFWAFRAKVYSGNCSEEYSLPASILGLNLHVLNHPKDTVVCSGNAVMLSAKVEPEMVFVNHQWQRSADGGTTWANIEEGEFTSAGGQYADVNSETLSIDLVNGLDGHMYRLHSSYEGCEVFTEAAILTIDDDPACEPQVPYVSLGIRLMPNKLKWGVYIKPMEGFEPSGYNVLTGAEVTIAATQGFVYRNLTSQAGGTWKPGAVLYNTADHPGLSFFSFQVEPNNNSLNLTENGVLLFTFARQDDCPDTLFLMTDEVPVGLKPNFVTGIDLGGADDEPFYLGGYHQIGTKGCINPVVDDSGLSGGIDIYDQRPAEKQDEQILPEGIHTDQKMKTASFEYFPNPAHQEVHLKLAGSSQGITSVRLVSLQGQILQTYSLNNTNYLRLDLTQITPGMYFLLLEKDGVVVQQEKLIKK